MIRTLQQKVVALQQEDAREHGDPEAMIKIFAETTITRLITEGGRIAGAFGYVRDTGAFVLFEAPAVILATGGHRQDVQGHAPTPGSTPATGTRWRCWPARRC